MWLTGTSLERIDSALGRGPTTEVDRLLAEILAGASSTEPTPTTCAVCRHDLTRSHLNHSPVLIYTCPDGHGSWLDGAGVATLQRLLQERAQPATSPASAAAGPRPHPARRLGVLIALLIASVATLAATILLTSPPARTGPGIAAPSPMTGAERRYFEELVVVLDDGITNRRNIDRILKGQSSPDTYVSAFDAYRVRQERFLHRLDEMSVPSRLQTIHDAIRRAADRQVGFYRDFKEARVRSSVDLPNLLGHPDLRESDYDLHRAWDLIRQTYPVLDPQLAEAIERHLCNLDIV